MAIFSSPEKKTAVPTDQVLKLRQQGYSDDRIVEMLQNDGYKSHQIFEAMSQADIKGMVAPEKLTDIPAPENPIQAETASPALPSLPRKTDEINEEKIEEIAEAIIDEKWDVLVENVNKIIDWKESVEKSIKDMGKNINDADAKLKKAGEELLEQNERQERKIIELEANVSAFAKVLQKVLPDLIAKRPIVAAGRPVSVSAPQAEKPAKKSRTEEIFGSIEDIS